MVVVRLLLLASAVAAGAQCLSANNTVHSCPTNASCFCEPTFDALSDTDGIVFSRKYNLSGHLWEPAPEHDARRARPAVVLIHGGGFRGHDRNDVVGIVDWCKRFASAGYVALSIDYRLGCPCNDTSAADRANLEAAYDAKAAVRWLRANAARYRVDATRIGAFGSSAGAMTVAWLAGLGDAIDEGDSGNAGWPSHIGAGVALSGMILTPRLRNISAAGAGRAPYLDLHGCRDTTVCYNRAACAAAGGKGPPAGTAVETIAALRAAGGDSGAAAAAELWSIPGAGHVPWDSIDRNGDAEKTVFAFFAAHLDLAHADCPRSPPPRPGPWPTPGPPPPPRPPVPPAPTVPTPRPSPRKCDAELRALCAPWASVAACVACGKAHHRALEAAGCFGSIAQLTQDCSSTGGR